MKRHGTSECAGVKERHASSIQNGCKRSGVREGEALKTRIQGFGNGPEPPPHPDTGDIIWDAVLEVGESLGLGANSGFSNEIEGWYQSAVSGFDNFFGIDEENYAGQEHAHQRAPSPPAARAPESKTRNHTPKLVETDEIGYYQVTSREAVVSATLALGGTRLANLSTGSVVKVLELIPTEQNRLRGRLEEPAGWISILDTAGGFRWATRVSDTSATSEAATSSATIPSDARDELGGEALGSQQPPLPPQPPQENLLDLDSAQAPIPAAASSMLPGAADELSLLEPSDTAPVVFPKLPPPPATSSSRAAQPSEDVLCLELRDAAAPPGPGHDNGDDAWGVFISGGTEPFRNDGDHLKAHQAEGQLVDSFDPLGAASSSSVPTNATLRSGIHAFPPRGISVFDPLSCKNEGGPLGLDF